MIDEFLKQNNIPLDISKKEKEVISKTSQYEWWKFGKALKNVGIEFKNELKSVLRR